MPESSPYTVIMHNSISLDGSYVGFAYTPEMMELHYRIAAGFGDSFRLMGSATCEHAIELFGGFSAETAEDRIRPQKDESLSYWAIPDSQAILMNKLHYFRRSEYCRDIVMLVSECTPGEYIDYLTAREYDYFVSGGDHVDLKTSLEHLAVSYDVKTFLVDAGRGLSNALINRGLVDMISLLLLPTVLGKSTQNLFGDVIKPQRLHLVQSQEFPNGYLWLLYDIEK